MTGLFSNFQDVSQFAYMEQIYAQIFYFPKVVAQRWPKIPNFWYFNFHPVFLKDYNNAGTISWS